MREWTHIEREIEENWFLEHLHTHTKANCKMSHHHHHHCCA